MIRRLVIRAEMGFYVTTALGFVAAIAFLIIGAPTISTLQLGVIQLFTGLTATLAAAASAIKTREPQ